MVTYQSTQPIKLYKYDKSKYTVLPSTNGKNLRADLGYFEKYLLDYQNYFISKDNQIVFTIINVKLKEFKQTKKTFTSYHWGKRNFEYKNLDQKIPLTAEL